MNYAVELLLGWSLITIAVGIVAYWMCFGYPQVERRLEQEERDLLERERNL